MKKVSYSLGTRTLAAIALPPSDYSVKADTAIDCCGQQFPKWNESLSKKWSLFALPSQSGWESGKKSGWYQDQVQH